MRPAPSKPSPAPSIDIDVRSSLWEAQPQAESTVRAAIVAAAAMLAEADGEVSVVLTDDAAIQTLNREWRGFDKPTNVLSFPAAKAGGAGLLGDIVIAYETLSRECADEDRAFLHHLAHIAVHGFLHLVGYDHQTDSQAEEMEGLESEIMLGLAMPDPYLDSSVVRDLDHECGDA